MTARLRTRSSASPGSARAALQWLPVALAVVAEGAWISVIAAFLQELVLRDSVIGLPHYVAAVAIGVLAARTIGRASADRWPMIGFGLLLVAAIAGLLAAPEARAALEPGAFQPDLALAANPGGLLVGLAVFRGYSHAHLPLAEDRLGRLFVLGILGLSFAALIGGQIVEPFGSRFQAEALLDSLVFAAATILALALARLAAVGAGAGVDWPRNPTWALMLVGIVAAVELLAMPASGVVRPVLELVLGVVVGPLLVVGLLFGWTRASLRAAVVVIVAGAVLLVIERLLFGSAGGTPAPGGGAAGPAGSAVTTNPGVATVGVALLVLGATVVVLLLIRAWMRGRALEPDTTFETRTIDHGSPDPSRPTRRRRLIRTAPTDAVAAYRRLLSDLAGRAIVARAPGETPGEHARRVRSDGWGRFGLELLAADYSIQRFAGRPLSEAEDRRAVVRWHRLRSELKPPVTPAPEELRGAGSDQRRGSRGIGVEGDVGSGAVGGDDEPG
jgi:hypothetical protein